jgi:fructose-1-phosphate kinase PfkB-like protein
VGHEFHDDEDFALALDQIADRGARNVIITTEDGCFAQLREERVVRRYRVVTPRLDPVSKVGTGDTLLGAFIAARSSRRPPEEQLRVAVAAGAASTAELGAGRFDPRYAARLQPAVEVTELTVAESPV